MKIKRFLTRLAAVLAGLLLLAGCLCALAETFFRVPFTAWAGRALSAETPLGMLLTLVLVLLLGLVSVGCVMHALPGRKQRSSGFVMQKAENGTIGVAIKSIEGMVKHCISLYDVIADADISVAEKRDGLAILLNVQEAAGVNIPLMVGALQKQIRQHVMDCTGVEVREVRVLVENCDASAVGSPYAVPPVAAVPTLVPVQAEEAAPVQAAAETPVAAAEEVPQSHEAAEAAEETETPFVQPEAALPEEEAAQEIPAEPVAAVAPFIPPMPELPEEEDDRPLHQRIFGTEEQPAIVPAPPELMLPPVEAAEEPLPEPVLPQEEAAEEPVMESEPVLAELVDEDAVTQVAQVMAYDSMLQLQPAYEDAAKEEACPNPDEELPEQL